MIPKRAPRARAAPGPPLSGDPDRELIRGALAGDHAAFEGLVGRYQDKVYRLARRMTGNPADAEEVLQDTFLQVHRRLASFRGEARFSTWLYRVATNAALMLRRGRARRPAASLEAFLPRFDRAGRHVVPDAPGGGAPLDEVLDHRRLARRAGEALERLPERYRGPFVLRDLEEMPTAEVSAVLGISEALVRQRVHRARLMLRGYLSQPGGGRP